MLKVALVLLPLVFNVYLLKAIGYDSTLVLSVKQKFAIPEEIENGDYVGVWQKTYTWRSGNIVRYSIHKNFKTAFAVQPISGLITITDASQIKGRIKQADTIINIIIRSHDPVLGYEDDTCEIRVKESKYCVFIDYQFSSIGNGSRNKPLNDFPEANLKPGFGYFIKRGYRVNSKTYIIPGIKATFKNPTVIATYSKGDNPVFDGANLTSNRETFNFQNLPHPSRFFYIYNIDIINYPSMAFRVSTGSSNFGIYNCHFRKNLVGSHKKGLGDIYFFGDPADTLINRKHELINLQSEGSWGPILKTDASGITAVNIKSATANTSHNFRFAISYYSKLSHFWFKGGKRSLQIRFPYVEITDGVIEGALDAAIFLVTDQTYEGTPDHLLINNVLFRNNEYGIYVYNSNIHNTQILNCLFDHNKADGIHFRNGGNNRLVKNCSFIYNGYNGLTISTNTSPGKNITLSHCLFYENKGKAVSAQKDSCAVNVTLLNNTIIGDVDLTGSYNEKVINNFYKSLRGASEISNNISLDSISIEEYFQDPAKNNYRLIKTANKAIGKGKAINQLKKSAFQSNVDIGAFPYEEPLSDNNSRRE